METIKKNVEKKSVKEVGKIFGLNRNNLIIGKVCPKEGKSNDPVRSYIYIETERTVATDGNRLIEVTREKLNADVIPTNLEYNENEPFLLEKEIAKKIKKSLEKKKNSLDILKNGIVNQDGDKIYIKTTDLESVKEYEISKNVLTFPKFQHVYPKSTPITQMTFNVKKLYELLGLFVDFTKEDYHNLVDIEVYGPYEPLKIVAKNKQEMKALIMPIRK